MLNFPVDFFCGTEVEPNAGIWDSWPRWFGCEVKICKVRVFWSQVMNQMREKYIIYIYMMCQSEYLLRPEDLVSFSPWSTVLLSKNTQCFFKRHLVLWIYVIRIISQGIFRTWSWCLVLVTAMVHLTPQGSWTQHSKHLPNGNPNGNHRKATEVEIGNMLGMHTAQEAYKEIVQNLWKNVT